MNTSFISQLLDVLLSPLALVGGLLGLAVVLQARRSRPLAWALFSVCCFCSSLAKHRSQYVLEAPALVFPLQQIREIGRPLTIVLLGALLLLTLSQKPSWRRHLLATPIHYLAAVQTVIFLKVFAEGSISFALIAAATFATVVYVFTWGPAKWISDDENFNYAAYALIGSSLIFMVANSYQAMFNLNPIVFLHGRLSGTTANPQHAATLLATTIPYLMFVYETSHRTWKKGVAFLGLALVGTGLFMTGSRTGMLMAITTVGFFYRNKGAVLIRLGIVLTLVICALLIMTGGDGFIAGIGQSDIASIGLQKGSVAARFTSIHNTREEPWRNMWQLFVNNPWFGSPVRGDRVGFGESSWLGAAATLGLAGFVPLVLFGMSCLKMMLQLSSIGRRQTRYYFHCSTVIAGLACLLVGSFFEAFLLGNLSFALFSLLTYLCLGQYLIERMKTSHAPPPHGLVTPSYVQSSIGTLHSRA